MNRVITLFILTLCCAVSFGQYQNKDSLLDVYHHATYDTSKIFALKWLSWHYYFKSSDSSNYFVNHMIDLSQKIDYKKGLYDAYNIQGILYYTKGNYDSAISVFNKAYFLSEDQKYYQEKIYALKNAGRSYKESARFRQADSCFSQIINLASINGDSASIARGYKNIAQNHSAQGYYQKALEYFFKADTFMFDDISIDHAENFHNIGILYNTLENAPAAITYFQEALTIYRKMDDSYGENAILVSLGSVEIEAGNYASARDHLATAHTFFMNYNDPGMLASVKFDLGRTAYHLGKFNEALDYYNATLRIAKNMEGSITLCNAYQGIGDTYAALTNFDQSIYYYNQALQIAYKQGNINTIVLINEALDDAYYQNKDLRKAYETMSQNQIFKDSINALKSDQMIHELAEKYQNEKKQQEIELLTTQNQLAAQEKRNQLIALGSIAGALVILSTFLFILYKNRQKTAKKLKELDTAKSNFFANISHEFRTPLTLIKNPVEDQLADKSLNKEQRNRMEMIDRNADRLLSLVDQLLDLAKLDAGSLQLKIEKTAISTFFKALIPAYEYATRPKGLTLSTILSEQLDEGWFDPDVLEKIISNLLSNAIKYTPENGHIELAISQVNGRLQLVVQNETHEPLLFDPKLAFERFYRNDQQEQGAGIGLALVKELVALHHGWIRVQQEKHAITFEIQLPIHKEAYRQEEISATPLLGSATGKQTSIHPVSTPAYPDQPIDKDDPVLLIVEDNAELAQLIHEQFADHYQVLVSANGHKGVEAAIKYVPDLIISDIMMPVKNGIELTETLKTDERTSHIPIILLTARADDADQLKGIETGADDYITKPFNKELLAARVQRLIEERAKLRKKYSQEVVLHPKEMAITSADEKFLQKIQDIIEYRLTDSAFNAEVFSKEMAMSRMQLHRKLKGLLGVTTTAFIRTERLKVAAHLLNQSDVSVSEVGYAVGFNDPSYFTRCFKEAYGVAPKAFTEEKA